MAYLYSEEIKKNVLYWPEADNQYEVEDEEWDFEQFMNEAIDTVAK